MASLASASTSQIVTLPYIPELFKPDFLDALVPAPAVSSTASDTTKMDVSEAETETTAVEPTPGNSFMNALKDSAKTGGLVRTDNADPAHGTTGSALLDAFQALAPQSDLDKLPKMLDDAWKEDPDLTLRMIWNARSIHDGKGERKLFYSAYFWLFEHHTRTAIANLPQLVNPVCKQGKAEEGTLAHGYYKDLLNILAFAFQGGDNVQAQIVTPKKLTKKSTTEKKSKLKDEKKATDESPSEAPVSTSKAERATLAHNTIDKQLSRPSLRALFIAVARLFASRLAEDLVILARVNATSDKDEAYSLTKSLSLAGKWAPSPGAGHDRSTNISSAIALLLFSSGALKQGDAPADLHQKSAVSAQALHALRASYQRHILAPLRKALALPEPLMSTGKWKEIHYPRVASEAMKLHTARFLQHDEAGFEKYLTDVESGKKVISGATLMPHILVGDVVELDRAKQASTNKEQADTKDGDKPRTKAQILADVKAKLADTQLRVVEAQWKTLLGRLRESGTLEGSLAICDVSGSMGSIHYGKPTKEHTQPIFPAIALSLLVAQVAKPPFAGGFVSFSAKPQYLEVDVDGSLAANVNSMASSDWGMNTDFRAVFLDLLLPIAVKHKVKPEDMIKRLFVFSDMQFDAACTGDADQWRSSHESIVKAYTEAGYEVPEMVYWNLAAQTDKKALRPMPVTAETPGVALMNGFSPAMLKVFMGDETLDEEGDWDMMDEEGAAPAATKETQAMDPISVMKKALNKGSFGGLKVLD